MFYRAGRNVSRSVELGWNLDILVAPVETYLDWSNLVVLDRSINVLVAPFETYLAWSNVVETLVFWSRRSKRISLGWAWSKPRYFGRAGRNVSRLVKLGRTWSKHKSFCRAGRNVSRSVELGWNLDILFAPVETYLDWSNLVVLDRSINFLVAPFETYLAWSNLVETYMFWSHRSKRISLGRTWSKHRSSWSCRRNIPRLVKLSPNLDVLVAPVKKYLAWSNVVETLMFWSRRSKRISLGWAWSKPRYFGRAGRNVSRLVKLGRTWSKHKSFCRSGRNVTRLVELGRNIDVFVALVETYLAWSNLVGT